jgi:hypothetical protein
MTEQILDSVFINCDCDETQLTVQGTPGQTQPLQEWRNSEGESLARITATGALETAGLDFSDGTVEAAAGAFESLTADAGTFESVSADTGAFVALSSDTVDINGGSIDGTVIGAETQATGRFTNITTDNGLTLGSPLRQVIIKNSSQAAIRLWCDAETGKAWSIVSHTPGMLSIQDEADGSPFLQLSDTLLNLTGANFTLGGTAPGSSATNTLVIADGDAPTSSPAGAVQLFADNVSGTIELRVRDSAGNVSTQSPHNPQMIDASNRISDWVHKEENPYLGYRMEVDLYAAVEALEKLTGQKFIHIEAMGDDERESWDANEAKNAALREEAIRAWEAEDTKTTARPEPYQRRAEPARFVAARNAVRKLVQ